MTKLNWIRNLSANELQDLLNSVTTVLLDLDGKFTQLWEYSPFINGILQEF